MTAHAERSSAAPGAPTGRKRPRVDGGSRPQLWAVILAGGDGTRLAGLTTHDGLTVPEQYCGLAGPRSLLRMALDRAGHLVPPSRTVVVVSEAHRHWWQRELAGTSVTALAQPDNRGTAAGILLPLLHVVASDRNAMLALFPSDHFVAREWTLVTAVARAAAIVEAGAERIVMLGVRPDGADPGYGWLVPGARWGSASSVRRFVEKPSDLAAAELMRAGALVNTFVMVVAATVLLSIFSSVLPELVASFRSGEDLATLYRGIPALDFSRDVLERVPERLSVLPVPPCGWSDLGTPERVAACLGRYSPVSAPAGEPHPPLVRERTIARPEVRIR